MPDPLAEYRAKRDFAATPEPAGARAQAAAAPRFVVQEHDATALHWDLRLERGGVLLSWAVPKGVPADPKELRLAVQTEDHPLDYGTFEGEIPEGHYGAGRVRIWDSGTYEPERFEEDKVVFRLRGRRVEGRYVLFRTKGKNWILRRLDPAPAGLERMPKVVPPMLAKAGELPRDERGWAYEVKWDGVRAVAFVHGGRVRLQSRNLLDVTHQYPEVGRLGRALGSRDAVLDGEIVAFDAAGRVSFGALQQRMGVGDEATARRRSKDTPVVYMLFDLLHLEGRDLTREPWRERRDRLEALGLDGAAWKTPPAYEGGGHAMLDATRAQGLEGVVAKRTDAPYEPGRRSGAWIKIKNQRRQEVVVGGWTQGEGRRAGQLGALLVGYHDDAGRLLFGGKVGTGFSEATLDDLARRLAPLARGTSPFAPGGAAVPRGANFVEPRLVAEVEFTEWTQGGTLRHPSFKGLREDKDPRDVVKEGT